MAEIDSAVLDKFAEDLFVSTDRMKRIREMTNNELAEVLEAYVSPNLSIFSFQADLVEIVIERLKGGN